MSRLVYIAHKIRAVNPEEINVNIQEVLQLCREIHSIDIIPFAPYLMTLQYLDENERDKGIAANKEYFRRRIIDELWICGNMISESMKEEIYLALVYRIDIKCYNPDLTNELKEVIKELQETRLKRP